VTGHCDRLSSYPYTFSFRLIWKRSIGLAKCDREVEIDSFGKPQRAWRYRITRGIYKAMDWSVAKVARLSEVETENCGILLVKHELEQLDRRGRVICG